jgi:hypothetical protein
MNSDEHHGTSSKHRYRRSSIDAPPVPPRPTLISIKRHLSKRLLSKKTTSSSTSFLETIDKNNRTFCDSLETKDFHLVLHHLECGRNWYRAVQHHLEVKSSIESRLATTLNETIESMELNNLKLSKDSRNASITNSHLQMYHHLKMSLKGWCQGILLSSKDLSTLSVRVRHLKRELKGTVGMLHKKSYELDAQLQKAILAPEKAAKKCREMESKLKRLETRYHLVKKRSRLKSGNDTNSANLESSVLALRDKTEAAKAKVIHYLTEKRVMKSKYDKCVQQMMTLTVSILIYQ